MKYYLSLIVFICCFVCHSNQNNQDKPKLEKEIANFEDHDMGDYSQYRDITGLVDAKEFHRLIEETDSTFIIDARPYDVYEMSPHIKGAHPIKAEGHLKYMTKDLDKKQYIMVYCEREVKSPYVVKYLIRAGFENVYELKGGLNAWQAVGYKVVAKKLKRQFLG